MKTKETRLSRRILVGLVLSLLCFVGCQRGSSLFKNGGLYGNGTGYSGLRSYDWRYPGYTCVPNGSTTPIPSVRDRIEITLSKGVPVSAVSHGDLCSTANTAIDPASLVNSSFEENYIGFQKGVYEQVADPNTDPTGTPLAEVWCHALLSKVVPSLEVLITMDGTGARQGTLYTSFKGVTSQQSLPAVSRTDTNIARTYLASGFNLAINTSALSPADPTQFSAELSGATVGRETIDAQCRITPIPAALLAQSPPAPNTLYVSPLGSDSNQCLNDAPCRQIRRALSLATPGISIIVSNGDYLGFDVTGVHATPSAPIAILGFGYETQVDPTTDRADNRDTITVVSSSNIVFQRINVLSAPRSGIHVAQSAGIQVLDSIFGDNIAIGIDAVFANDFKASGNMVYGSGTYAISVSNSSQRPIVTGNLIHDNGGIGIMMDADLSAGGSGLMSGGSIAGNTIYNCGSVAIDLDGVQNTSIVNNLAYGNQGKGIAAYMTDGAAGPKGLIIENNTVVMPVGSASALKLANSTGTNTLRNNILYQNDSSLASLELNNATDLADLNSDYNILQSVLYSNNLVTLANWKTAHPQEEAHSFSSTAGALFNNPAANDYSLSASSPAISAGQSLPNITTDILGFPRPAGSPFDIGAFQFQ